MLVQQHQRRALDREEATFCLRLKHRPERKGWLAKIDPLLATTDKGDGYRPREYVGIVRTVLRAPESRSASRMIARGAVPRASRCYHGRMDERPSPDRCRGRGTPSRRTKPVGPESRACLPGVNDS